MESNSNLLLTKLLSKFVKSQTKRDDLDIVVENHEGKDYLILVVDWAKMDKNSDSYDESYSNFVRDVGRKTGGGFFFLMRHTCLTDLTFNAKKLLDLDLEYGFKFKNYDHLDDIESKVSNAIKQTEYPQIEIGLSAEWESPILKMDFYNVPYHLFDNWDNFKNYQSELEIIMNNKIDLDQYRITTTSGEKK